MNNPFPRLPCGWSHARTAECPEGWTDQEHAEAIRAKNNGEHWIHPSKRKPKSEDDFQPSPIKATVAWEDNLIDPRAKFDTEDKPKRKKPAKQKATATYAKGCPACEARRAADQARLKRFRDKRAKRKAEQ